MNPEIFKQIHDVRCTYPLGVRSPHENADDEKYINDEISRQSGSDFIFLLLVDFHLDKPQARRIKESLLADLNIVGIFKVGEIWAPFTGIKFNLYVLSRDIPNKVWFGELSENKKPFANRPFSREFAIAHELKPIPYVAHPYFLRFLESIDLAIYGGKKDDYIAKEYRIFGADAAIMNGRHSIDYYKPELIEMQTKLAHEKTATLGEIAEIIYPRRAATEGQLTIELSKAKYPLRPEMLREARPTARVAEVHRYDIVTNSFLNSAYLNMTKRSDLVAANTQVIIRVHDKRFTPAYITAYLNSDRMRAYFSRHSVGAVMPRLNREDLANFEIVVPSRYTNEVATGFLASLGEFDSAKTKIDAINNNLFTPIVSTNKPLQNELLIELQLGLQGTKNALIRDLFDVDLSEIEKCYKAGAYKGCLVLCGSLLEALVLDWLSELEETDYFSSEDFTSLEIMINRLRDAEVLTVHELQMAHEIRKKRNLIHPKNYIENTPLHKEICEEVMTKLKPLVEKRYNYREGMKV